MSPRGAIARSNQKILRRLLEPYASDAESAIHAADECLKSIGMKTPPPTKAGLTDYVWTSSDMLALDTWTERVAA